jgi:hypothetical protein
LLVVLLFYCLMSFIRICCCKIRLIIKRY